MRGYGMHAMRARRGRLQRSGPAAYSFTNSEASAFIARMTVPPSNTYKAAIDKLWTRLKVGAVNGTNVSTAFDVFYVRAMHTSQAALLNMMGSSFTATLSTNAPIFHAGYGFTTNGIDSYVEWGGWRPSDWVQFAQNSASIGCWSRRPDAVQAGAAATDSAPALGTTTGNATQITPRNSGGANAGYRINSGTTSTASNADGSGFFCAVRPDAATQRLFKNGAQIGVDAAVTSASRSATVIREGCANNGTLTVSYVQNQSPFSFAGRALTANEVADLYAALQEYQTAIGWVALMTIPTGDANIRAAATALPAYTSRVALPDAVPTVVAGKGFTCTGAALDARDGTWWVSAFGRNVQGDTSSTFQPYVVHLDTDRATPLGTPIDLAALGVSTVSGLQGIAFDTSDNTLGVMQASGTITHIAASTTSPATIGSPIVTGSASNGLAYDSLRDKLVHGQSSLNYLNKDGTTTNLPTLKGTVPYLDQIAYMADLDAFLVTGGPNGSDAVIAVMSMGGQNYGALRLSALYTAPGMTAIEAGVRNPATKVMTGFNDFWYHGGGGSLANSSALVQLPF